MENLFINYMETVDEIIELINFLETHYKLDLINSIFTSYNTYYTQVYPHKFSY